MKDTISLTAAQAGQRLDVALANATDHTRSYWRKRLVAGDVTSDGQPVHASLIVNGDETFEIAELPKPAPDLVPELTIVYQDPDLLVVDKPAGLLVHSAHDSEGQATVAAFAALHSTDPDTERPGIVHRLDRDTSGLLVIAKTVEAKISLQAAFKDRQVTKTYLALVEGNLQPDEATISLPISRKPGTPTKRAVVATGKPAETTYRVTAHYPGYTLVEAKPKTGRTHQLRVHFAALGHPIAGDLLYGARPMPGLGRHFLHAATLEFDGPSGQHVSVARPLPPDLAPVVQTLRDAV